MLTENNLTKPMTLLERDRALHEQFKATLETMRLHLTELSNEIIPVMEGTLKECKILEPEMPTFICSLYEIDDSDFVECLNAAEYTWRELKEIQIHMVRLSDEIRELRKNPRKGQ